MTDIKLGSQMVQGVLEEENHDAKREDLYAEMAYSRALKWTMHQCFNKWGSQVQGQCRQVAHEYFRYVLYKNGLTLDTSKLPPSELVDIAPWNPPPEDAEKPWRRYPYNKATRLYYMVDLNEVHFPTQWPAPDPSSSSSASSDSASSD